MNINEKRKLEALVASKLSTARSVYKHKRETEYNGLVKEVEETLPPKIQAVVAEGEKVRTAFFAQREALEAKALALGFRLRIRGDEDDEVSASLERSGRWINGEYQYSYTEPTIEAHAVSTNNMLAALDDLQARYNVDIWSETADMKKIFEKFEKELEKVAV